GRPDARQSVNLCLSLIGLLQLVSCVWYRCSEPRQAEFHVVFIYQWSLHHSIGSACVMYHREGRCHIFGSTSASPAESSSAPVSSLVICRRVAGREMSQPNHSTRAYSGTPMTNRAVPSATTSLAQYMGSCTMRRAANTSTMSRVAT